MKICKYCGIEKNLNDFSPNKGCLQGVSAKCKKCAALAANKKYAENPELGAKKQAEYRKRYPNKSKEDYQKVKLDPEKLKKKNESTKNWFKKNPDYYKEYYWSNEEFRKKKIASHKEWSLKNAKAFIENTVFQRKKFPLKYKARCILRDAVHRKKINKPKKCENCLIEFKRIEGHHEDYSRPLDVKWLCVGCHKDLHRNKKEP